MHVGGLGTCSGGNRFENKINAECLVISETFFSANYEFIFNMLFWIASFVLDHLVAMEIYIGTGGD